MLPKPNVFYVVMEEVKDGKWVPVTIQGTNDVIATMNSKEAFDAAEDWKVTTGVETKVVVVWCDSLK